MSTVDRHPPIHDWLTQVHFAWVPGPATPLLDNVMQHLVDCFRQAGHIVLAQPGDPPGADVILTSAAFGQPLHFRSSLTLTARRRYGLERNPTVFTLLHATPAEWHALIEHLDRAVARETPNPDEFAFPGMARMAYHTLYEQGKRGGSLMAVARIVQSQAMSIRNIVIIGDEARPMFAYTFDLVGAHPRSEADGLPGSGGERFLSDLMYRILTAVCTHEITQHVIEEPAIPLAAWQALKTPRIMATAGSALGKLGFFTEMVKVDNLVDIPLLDHAIASQYSEGCYATWEPDLDALVCTITGSARPVEKDRLTDDELAIITGIRADRKGARVRHVEGKRNDPPSSEAVEMVDMDGPLPRVRFHGKEVPVARSKLHGHRSVRSFDPGFVEHVYLDPAYYNYPVSCSTEAQASAIRAAFTRSQALNNPADPRQIVFTVLPGHGVLIVEKWLEDKAPFEIILDAIRDGRLQIENSVPQGLLEYRVDGSGRCVLYAEVNAR